MNGKVSSSRFWIYFKQMLSFMNRDGEVQKIDLSTSNSTVKLMEG